MKETFQLRVKSHIDAAHYIKDYEGKCNRMHGHRWGIEVVLEGCYLDKLNMLIDFSVVKTWLKSILEDLDHYVLNEQLPRLNLNGESDNVTAEYLSKWLYYQLEFCVQSGVERGLDPSTELSKVIVCESPDCCVSYAGLKV